MIKSNIYSIILLLTLSSHLVAQNKVKGYVYNDVNSNSIKDSSETGISSVGVSNGRDVVVTDNKGYYELNSSGDNIIFVIKPSDYKFPVNKYHQPLFYYIHKPNGSPKLHFKGTSPTGKLPDELNFPLYKDSVKEQFRILVFGDPQPKNLTEIDYFKRGIVDELIGVKNVEFGMSLGDLVHDDLNLYSPYKEVIGTIGIPWLNVMGNHDIN